MSASERPDLARGWLRAEKLLEEEADRVAKMSDEEFEREIAAQPDPARVPSAAALLPKAGGERAAPRAVGAKVEALPVRRRTPWTITLIAAALGALAILVVVTRPPPNIESHPWPIAQERAAELRQKALHHCEAREWQACLRDLDAARDFDPKGDLAPAVRDARDQAAKGMQPAPNRAPDDQR